MHDRNPTWILLKNKAIEAEWLAYVLCFLRMILQGMQANRFQLLLTVLTMSVGSFTLALSLFLGEGALACVWQDIEKMMGSWVIAYSDAGKNDHLLRTRQKPDFTEGDLQYLTTHTPQARLITPIYMNAHPVMYNDIRAITPVDGITAELRKEPMFMPLNGPGISQAAFDGLTWECMITESAAREMGIDLQQESTVIIDRQPFRVRGITPDPPRIDDRFKARMIVPFAAARALWMCPGTVGHILVAWRIDQMDTVVWQVKQALDEIRGPGTYYLSSSQFSIERGKNIVSNFMVFGAAQAMFCILVASIGVLNVMLTSVTRRTHEFSVRIAMGARQQEILLAVVLESVLIGVIGALCGIAAAIALAPYFSGLVAAKIPQAALIRPEFCLKGILYPFAVCGLSSLVAGIIPALRIRCIDVLASLRLEA